MFIKCASLSGQREGEGGQTTHRGQVLTDGPGVVPLDGGDAGDGPKDLMVGDEGGGPQVGKNVRVGQDERADVQGDEVLVGSEGGVRVEVAQGGQGQVDEAVEGVADVDLWAGQGSSAQGAAQELQVRDLVRSELLGQLKGGALDDGFLAPDDGTAAAWALQVVSTAVCAI